MANSILGAQVPQMLRVSIQWMIGTLNRAGFSVAVPVSLDRDRFVEMPDIVLTNSTYLQLIGLLCTHLDLTFTFHKSGVIAIADTKAVEWSDYEISEAHPPSEIVPMTPFVVGDAIRNNG